MVVSVFNYFLINPNSDVVTRELEKEIRKNPKQNRKLYERGSVCI